MMTGTRTLAFRPLIRRFVAPAISAWLLYIGVWLVLLAIEPLVLSVLTKTVGWFALQFFSSGIIEWSWRPIRPLMEEAAEGGISIFLGLLVGLWVVRKKKRLEA